MNIVMHSIYFYPEIGGLENHIFYLAKEFVKRKHQIKIVTTRSNRKFPSYEVIDGISIYRRGIGGKSFLFWIINTLLSVPIFLKVSKDADIIHAQTFPAIIPGIFAKKRDHKPLIATIHTSHFLRLAKKCLWKSILRFLLKNSNVILTPSEEIKNVCLKLRGESPGPKLNIMSFVNGVDTDFFKPTIPAIKRKNKEFIIICPRRLFPKNGVEYLIRAMPEIRNKIDSELYIIGDGPLRASLEELALELKMKDYIHFLGMKPNIEMPGYLSSADVVVIPSLLEATSIAALEAMSCERVVAASRVGGLPEIIDEKVGLLFEPGDSSDLAQKVATLLFKSNKEEMGREARKRVVGQWDLKNIVREHLDLYVAYAKHLK